MKKYSAIIGLFIVYFSYSCFSRETGKPFYFNSSFISTNTFTNEKDTGKVIHFPRDHSRHYKFVTEWWYFNGHLNDSAGKSYSYELCLFRRFPLIYFAHISLTDEDGQTFSFGRRFYPFFKAKLAKHRADISYGKKQILEQLSSSSFRIKGTLKDVSFEFLLELEKTPFIVNGNGKINMEGGKSFYYSLTRLKTSGSIKRDNQLTPVTGISWMDHQWGNFRVIHKKWDWFSFQMEDGVDYNLYSFRNKKNRIYKQFANTLDENGKQSLLRKMVITRDDWWQNQKTLNWFPTSWEIIFPERRDTFFVTARMQNQELFSKNKFDFLPSYWEGACSVIRKTADGKIIKGLGFAEQFPFRKNKMK